MDMEGNLRRDVLALDNCELPPDPSDPACGWFSDMGAFEYQSAPECGDHVIDPGEACDDGNTGDGDGCSATCDCGLVDATSCADVLAADPDAKDGVYRIQLEGMACPMEVYCDLTRSGGGWTLVAIYGFGPRPTVYEASGGDSRPGASFYGVIDARISSVEQ